MKSKLQQLSIVVTAGVLLTCLLGARGPRVAEVEIVPESATIESWDAAMQTWIQPIGDVGGIITRVFPPPISRFR